MGSKRSLGRCFLHLGSSGLLLCSSFRGYLMKKGFLHWAKIFGSGLCVGAADIAPGISGGTVAFIIGIYEELLKSIATLNGKALSLLFRGKIKAFFDQVAWQFLLSILLGVAC